MAEQRYRVIERIEAGGMAEVFKGTATSVEGFKKQVAIKRVLPHLAENKKFMTMFLDEARLGARLSHANIVTVFDIGHADSTYFIVMEYVDGLNLKNIMEFLRENSQRVPTNEAMYICMEACRGLSYAHELTDDDGAPLHIVHRDISPPNILITKRGEVKLTDFGLAKATTQLEKTDPGVVKGKFSYLSPEAAGGAQVDARADIFALGVVLWEMLAGRRLFLGENDYQTVKLVQQAYVPSLQRLNPEVNLALEELVRKALAQDPNVRFSSAREMGDALAGYLFSHQRKVTSYDIANLVTNTMANRARASAQVSAPSMIDRLIQEEIQKFTSLEDGSEPLADMIDAEALPGRNTLVEGATPLDASSFENPAEWFRDETVGGTLAGAAKPAHGLSNVTVGSPVRLSRLPGSTIESLIDHGSQDPVPSETKPLVAELGPLTVKSQPKSNTAAVVIYTILIIGGLLAGAYGAWTYRLLPPAAIQWIQAHIPLDKFKF